MYLQWFRTVNQTFFYIESSQLNNIAPSVSSLRDNCGVQTVATQVCENASETALCDSMNWMLNKRMKETIIQSCQPLPEQLLDCITSTFSCEDDANIPMYSAILGSGLALGICVILLFLVYYECRRNRSEASNQKAYGTFQA